MPVKVEPTPPLASLSPVAGKAILARFDGGQLSSDAGVLVLREVEQRLGIAERLAACIADPRLPERVRHGVADILRFRMLMIAAGYEDGNDADSLRHDPAFKLALNHLPDGDALCSQPTISRLENLPGVRSLLHMARAMVELYCDSFRQVPRRIVLDVDDTFDTVYGEQQLRLFNAHYDEYGFQPIVVFDGEGRPVTAMLRPAKRPSGREARAFLRRLVRAIRGHWPRVEILIRADSHYCAPEVLDFCRAEGLDFILGVASTTTLRRHVEVLEGSTAALRAATPGAEKQRRYKEFLDGAGSWSRVERIIARVGPAHCAGRAGRRRHPLCCHQPVRRLGPQPLRTDILQAGTSGKSYQGLETAARRRPHLMLACHSEPVPPAAAHRRLLADVVTPQPDAEALDLARCPVRHPPPVSGEACRPRGRTENPRVAAPAQRLSLPSRAALRSRTATASDPLSNGADAPAELFEPQPQTSQSAPLCRPSGAASVTRATTTDARAATARPALASSVTNYPG
jgi:hypothetical protein